MCWKEYFVALCCCVVVYRLLFVTGFPPRGFFPRFWVLSRGGFFPWRYLWVPPKFVYHNLLWLKFCCCYWLQCQFIHCLHCSQKCTLYASIGRCTIFVAVSIPFPVHQLNCSSGSSEAVVRSVMFCRVSWSVFVSTLIWRYNCIVSNCINIDLACTTDAHKLFSEYSACTKGYSA